MLRISYEVIKSLYPEDYVATGGLGYPSFLDLILRQTDNPDQGKVTQEFPLPGGAYFDVLSFHSYPHIDNSLREWSNDVGGFVYFRHSDRCVDGMLRLRNKFDEVLKNYGYDGQTYPQKRWIVTESNIPRVQFGEYIGSNEAQANYLIKSAVACQQNGIDQLQVYQLGDIESGKDARNEFQLMGLFTELDSLPRYEQQRTAGGVAYATVSQLLNGSRYDAVRTAAMLLPGNIGGAAFKSPTNGFTYVLWAMTDKDRSEEAKASYSFPASLNLRYLHRRAWDFASQGITTVVNADDVELTGSPIFLRDSKDDFKHDTAVRQPKLLCSPNPFSNYLSVQLVLPDPTVCSLSLYDITGRLVQRFFNQEKLAEGPHQFRLPSRGIANGLYLLRYESYGGSSIEYKVLCLAK